MIGPLLLVLFAYLGAAVLGGVAGVLWMLLVALAGYTYLIAAEVLHLRLVDRRTRRIVYRRWTAWEYQDWLRRHTAWRRRP